MAPNPPAKPRPVVTLRFSPVVRGELKALGLRSVIGALVGWFFGQALVGALVAVVLYLLRHLRYLLVPKAWTESECDAIRCVDLVLHVQPRRSLRYTVSSVLQTSIGSCCASTFLLVL